MGKDGYFSLPPAHTSEIPARVEQQLSSPPANDLLYKTRVDPGRCVCLPTTTTVASTASPLGLTNEKTPVAGGVENTKGQECGACVF